MTDKCGKTNDIGEYEVCRGRMPHFDDFFFGIIGLLTNFRQEPNSDYLHIFRFKFILYILNLFQIFFSRFLKSLVAKIHPATEKNGNKK